MDTPELRHRLLAILAADGVGFSRLMGMDERGTVVALDNARAVFREQIAGHGGRLVDTAGDSVLAVFDTATGAVGAALAVQAKLVAERGNKPPDACLRFRIGVHLGDVFEKDDGTVYGDGVNVAARLQTLADPDGLVVSQSIQTAVQGRVHADFQSMGAQSVKNIEQPVLVFRVHPSKSSAGIQGEKGWSGSRRWVVVAAALLIVGGAVATWQWNRSSVTSEDTVSVGSDSDLARKTIAVLPFANISADPSNEYFVDGITEELILMLSQPRGLEVTPRASSFHFKGKSVPLDVAAQMLGVDYLVDGSVRRDGAHVRIAAQLIDGRSSEVIWSRTFDREIKDVLAAQTEIALGISSSLTVSLDGARSTYDLASMGGRETADPAAWQIFIEASRLPGEERIAAYERVIAMDPNFARAHAKIAEVYLALSSVGEMPRTEASQRMIEHLEQALRIDPHYEHAYGLLGAAARIIDDLDALQRYAERGIAANPEGSGGNGWQGWLELHRGDVTAALPRIERATRILSLLPWARVNYSRALRFANRPAEALKEAEFAVTLDPENPEAREQQALSLIALGRRDEALRIARERNLFAVLARYGNTDDQTAMHEKTQLDGESVAWQQYLAGKPEAVVAFLEAERSDDLQNRAPVLFDPLYDPLRELPEFKAWLARHNLTEAHERAQAWRAANPIRTR